MGRMLVLFLLCAVVTGCGSFRFTSTISPTEEPQLSLGGVGFHISSGPLKTESKGAMNPALVSDKVQAAGKRYYPLVYSDDFESIPLRVGMKVSDFKSSTFLTIFTTLISGLGVLPVMGWTEWDIHIDVNAVTPEGYLPIGKTMFSRRDSGWVTIWTPLGFFPVVGPSDISRGYWMLMDNSNNGLPPYQARVDEYSNACVAAAITQILKGADLEKMKSLREDRRQRLTPMTVDGKTYWVYLGFLINDTPAGGEVKNAVLLVYSKSPDFATAPVETIVVASRGEDGRWRPQTGYFRKASTLTSASVLMEGGQPVRPVFKQVTEPQLDDFIAIPPLPAGELLEYIRWSNGALLQVKNSTLSTIIANGSKDELAHLATRIEQAVLDLTAKVEMAKDQAQRNIENKQDPTAARTFSIVYQQRIEVFRPIVNAIKQGIATKQ